MESLVEKIKLVHKRAKENKNLCTRIEKSINLILRRMDEIEYKPFIFEDIFKTLKGEQDLAAPFFNNEDVETINEIGVKIEHSKELFARRFGDELDKKCASDGFKISGKLPDLKIGFFTLSCDFSKNEAKLWFGPRIEQLDKSKLDIDKIVKLIKDALLEFEKRKPTDSEFIKDLFQSHTNVVMKSNLENGRGVPLTDILLELSFLKQRKEFFLNPKREFYTSYARSQFAYNLYSLKTREMQNLRLNLDVATREDTKNEKTNIWVPVNERGDGVHFSTLSFKS